MTTKIVSESKASLIKMVGECPYGQLGDGGIVPDRAAKYITAAGERIDLDKDQYMQYATDKGQGAYQTAEAVRSSNLYKSMTDSQKAESNKAAYQYADAVAKETLGVG